MTIKTKYEIGQDVWIMHQNMPQRVTVSRIDVYVASVLNLNIQYKFLGIDQNHSYSENQVFKTADALKKHLFEQ